MQHTVAAPFYQLLCSAVLTGGHSTAPLLPVDPQLAQWGPLLASIRPPRTFSPAVGVIPLILASVIKRIRYLEFIDLALLMGGIDQEEASLSSGSDAPAAPPAKVPKKSMMAITYMTSWVQAFSRFMALLLSTT